MALKLKTHKPNTEGSLHVIATKKATFLLFHDKTIFPKFFLWLRMAAANLFNVGQCYFWSKSFLVVFLRGKTHVIMDTQVQ